MTRLYLTTLIALIICVAIKSQAESIDNAERIGNANNDRDDSIPDDSDRLGAQAYAAASASQSGIMRPQIKFVNCFACVDCPKVLENTTSKFCPYTNDPTKSNKCVVYAQQYSQLKKHWYIRGCASERGSCDDIRRGHELTPSVKLLHCNECEGDRCNGVTHAASNIATALLFLIICPIVGKYILS